MNTATIRSDWVGRVIDGRFSLLEWLGGSEQSSVFFTKLPDQDGQKAAIKLFPAGAENEEACMANWAAASALSHSHLMRLYHSGRCRIESEGPIYVVTEYAEEVLSEILEDRALTPAEVKEMLLPTLDALGYLHGKGFVHSRLKPSNILVVDDDLKLSVDGLHMIGKPSGHVSGQSIYDAPEREAGMISPASDVWSLGVTLVEALTQTPPEWDRASGSAPVVPDSLPQPYADIVRHCLRLDPAQRCTLNDVQTRLDPGWQAPIPAPVPPPAPALVATPSEPEEDSPQVSRKAAIVGAAIIALAVIAFLVVGVHKTHSPSSTDQQSAPAETATPSEAPTSAVQPARRTTIKGEVAEKVMPDVLPRAQASIQGRLGATIRVMVDANGGVSNAEITSQGPSRYFADRALHAARMWKFRPAQVNGAAVPSTWNLRFEFRRSGNEVIAAQATP